MVRERTDVRDSARLGRRAMLAAAVGGVAAAIGSLVSPGRTLAADDDPVLVGHSHDATHPTSVHNTGELWGLGAQGDHGPGIFALTSQGGSFGVYGGAIPVNAIGVRGENNIRLSRGDLGTATAGVLAVQGSAPLALNVAGKAHFSRSGIATVLKGKRFVQVDVEGLTNDSFALATLQQYRAGLWVQSVTVSASTGAIYIYVSQYAPSDTRVAWTVLD